MTGGHVAIDAIDSFVEEQMTVSRAPGVAISIHRDGEIVYERGYGYADLERGTAMTERTGVVIGSTTKALTCLAMVQLADQSAVDLDDPVQRHLPWFRVADVDASSRITIRHTLTHTAGLRPSMSDDPHFLFNDDNADDALDRFVHGLRGAELLWPPGDGWVYANDGYSIAGRVIEAVSGQSYEGYMREHIFGPLGLADTVFSHEDRSGLHVATPYDYDRTGTPYPSFFPQNRSASAAGAQLIMSGRDAGRWLQALLDGGRIGPCRLVSDASFAELTRPQVVLPPTSARATGASYGLGWVSSEMEGTRLLSHAGGAITMGSDFIIAPDHRLGVAVVANSCSDSTAVIAEGVTRLMLDLKPIRRFPHVDWSFQPDRRIWQRFPGTYQALSPQNAVPGPLRIKLDSDGLRACTYPGDRYRRPGDIFFVPVTSTDFVLFGRGRTGGLAGFTMDNGTVHATLSGVPLVKIR